MTDFEQSGSIGAKEDEGEVGTFGGREKENRERNYVC